MPAESYGLTDRKKSNEMTRQNNIVESCVAACAADDGASSAVLEIGGGDATMPQIIIGWAGGSPRLIVRTTAY